MKVRDKIAQKKLRVKSEMPAETATAPKSKNYTCTCKQCKIRYETTNSLDLDGLGRCPPCRAIHDAELEAMMHKFPQAQRDAQPSYEERTGIEDKGRKRRPLH